MLLRNIAEMPSSKDKDIRECITRILSPFRSDRWLTVAIYGAIAAIGLSIGTLAWNWSDLQTNPSEQAKRRFDASLSVISTGATISAGVVLYLNFRVANRNAEIAQKKLDQETKKARQDAELAEAKLVSERFSTAVGMLGGSVAKTN